MFYASTLYIRNAMLGARSSELHGSAHPPPPQHPWILHSPLHQTMMVLIPTPSWFYFFGFCRGPPFLVSSQLPLLLLPWCLFASISHVSFRFSVSCALIHWAPLRRAIKTSPNGWLSSCPCQLTLPQWLVGLSLFSLLGFLHCVFTSQL